MTTLDTSRPLAVGYDDTPRVHEAASWDEMQWWLPHLGPGTTVLVNLLAQSMTGGSRTWHWADLATMTGLLASRVRVSLIRAQGFGALTIAGPNQLVVRQWLPTVSERNCSRMPEWWQAMYEAELTRREPLMQARGVSR